MSDSCTDSRGSSLDLCSDEVPRQGHFALSPALDAKAASRLSPLPSPGTAHVRPLSPTSWHTSLGLPRSYVSVRRRSLGTDCAVEALQPDAPAVPLSTSPSDSLDSPTFGVPLNLVLRRVVSTSTADALMLCTTPRVVDDARNRASSPDQSVAIPPAAWVQPCHEDAELCCRLSRARQTVDFARRARAALPFSTVLPLRDSLLMLRRCPSVASQLVVERGNVGGEFGTSCRMVRHLEPSLMMAHALLEAHPQQPWLAFVGLVHALGRLLLLPEFGNHAMWSIVGETFPVGCRFDEHVTYSNWFAANPDKRRRALNTPFGLYAPGCGLNNVDMCFSGDEYLFEVCVRNRLPLPPAALFLIRYGSFHSLGMGAKAYEALLTYEERGAMQWLPELRAAKHKAYTADAACVDMSANDAAAMVNKLQGLLDMFCPAGEWHM